MGQELDMRVIHIVYLHIATAEVVITETERERERGKTMKQIIIATEPLF